MERKLASIQKVLSVEPIENADAIEKITVLGWHCVAKKGEFKVGDNCIYCEVDSVLPEKPEFEFLKDRHYRIRTIKLRGQVSQGICFPLSTVNINGCKEGDDVTDIMGIIKYEQPIPVNLMGLIAGNFPAFIPKTDEIRIQSVPEVLVRHKGTPCYFTEKVDGCSYTTWIYNDEFGVASRNMRYKITEDSIWGMMATKFKLEEKLKSLHRNIALQGELLGKVQGNKYQLKSETIKWFNAYDIDKQTYLTFDELLEITLMLGFETVPFLGTFKLDHTVDQLVEMAKGKSMLANVHREGIVIRSVKESLDIDLGRMSFKVINPDFLLKFEE